MRVQKGSAIHHGETAALENSGRLPASAYKGATMFTTLSPCDMCTGACILYGISRVVIGENKTFLGGEAYLKSRGVEVVVMENEECRELMEKFIREKPEVWYVHSAGYKKRGLIWASGMRILGRKSGCIQKRPSEQTCRTKVE
jgi:creatinine deaminase